MGISAIFSSLTLLVAYAVKGYEACSEDEFLCANSYGQHICENRFLFCNGVNDCGDRIDEKYCDEYKTRYHGGCPTDWWKCVDGRCIPSHWKCNAFVDCIDGFDEYGCVYPKEIAESSTVMPLNKQEGFFGNSLSRWNLAKWFMRRRKNGATTNKWGHELPRTAVALYLADKDFFSPGNKTMEEMSYELTIQLLSHLNREETLNKNELANYIHALMVNCIDPRNFYGRDLVSDLRSKVEGSGNSTNPFDFIVLCNAGDTMTDKDVERISAAYESQRRPFWTDNQAMATMALACVSSSPGISVDERTLVDMAQKLKKRQFRNGTVDNLKTTALVVQALIATHSYQRDFDLEAAIRIILQNQKVDGSIGSFLDSYYILPVLSNSSFLNITSEHCKHPTISEEEALNELQRTRGERLSIQYSVWIGSEVDLRKTWTLKVPMNSSFYDILEIVNRLDTRQQLDYNVIDGKPFVTSLTGLQDDVEKGLYWFTFVRSQNSDEDPKLVEESPVDVIIRSNQELILWYKTGQ